MIPEFGKNLSEEFPGILTRGDGHQLHVGVGEKQTNQFLAGVARGANDRDGPGVHMDAGLTCEGTAIAKPSGFLPAPFFYRLLYWKRFRAPGWPYFFRSLMRGSRVSSPSALSVERRFGSTSSKALEIPCRTAPAWPDGPPPRTLARTSNLPARSVRLSGCSTW